LTHRYDGKNIGVKIRLSSDKNWFLSLGIESPKSADQNILAIRERGLDGFQDKFKDAQRFEFGNAEAVGDGVNEMVFGEGHG
jgi:hypothetical protein